MESPIAAFRKRRSLTLEAFAAMIGTTATTVFRYETFKRQPRPKIAHKIVAATEGEIALADLYREEEAAA